MCTVILFTLLVIVRAITHRHYLDIDVFIIKNLYTKSIDKAINHGIYVVMFKKQKDDVFKCDYVYR